MPGPTLTNPGPVSGYVGRDLGPDLSPHPAPFLGPAATAGAARRSIRGRGASWFVFVAGTLSCLPRRRDGSAGALATEQPGQSPDRSAPECTGEEADGYVEYWLAIGHVAETTGDTTNRARHGSCR